MARASPLLALLLASPLGAAAMRLAADNLSSTPEESGLLDSPWLTVHDIDAAESAGRRSAVHSEENCGACLQGDIMVPPAPGAGGGSSLAEAPSYALGGAWPDGVVYYRWKKGMNGRAMEVTKRAMAIWAHKTCVKFEEAPRMCLWPRKQPKCYPVVMGSDLKGCSAHVGYYGASFQSYNLGEGCHHVGTALHELGHVLGLSHEQERYDRDTYVETIIPNVKEESRRWFAVNPWRSESTRAIPYDLSSVMHYDAWAFAVSRDYKDPSTATIRVKEKDQWGNCKIGQRAQLSVGDVVTVGVMYDCPTAFCADRHSRCGKYAEERKCPGGGAAPETELWMRDNCAAACGLCKCQDNSKHCADFVVTHGCPQQELGAPGTRNWMKVNCAKSCGICGPSDLSCRDMECRDGWRPCQDCARLGGRKDEKGRPYCEYGDFQRVCPRTCGACPAQVFC